MQSSGSRAFSNPSRSRSEVFAHTSTGSSAEEDAPFVQHRQRHLPAHEMRRLFEHLERGLSERLDRLESLLHRFVSSSKENHVTSQSSEQTVAHLGSMSAQERMNSCEREQKLDERELLLEGLSSSSEAMAELEFALQYSTKAVHKTKSRDRPLPQAMHLSLRREWQREASRSALEAPALNARALSVHSDLEQLRSEEESNKSRFVLHPSSRFRLAWDLTTMAIIAHDMAVVPVSLAFRGGEDIHLPWLSWPFSFFWTMDLVLSFLTGFYRRGRIELRLRPIALHYMKTWFILDFVTVFVTWMDMIAGEGHGYLLGRVVKSCRVLRVMHSGKIMRFAKFGHLSQVHDRVTSEYYHILISVVKLMVTILWINHFIACGWWAVGANSPKDWERKSWTDFYQLENDSLSYQYLTSLHWSLTQFTPAGMEVSAKNAPERVFSIIVLLFAMVAFSSFISSITASITQLRQLAGRYDTNFSMLRTYLQSHGVKEDLVFRILHCVDYRLRRETTEIQESQVQFLQLLSKPLQMELCCHMYAPTLSRHPFFWRYAEMDHVAMRHVCLKAVSMACLSTEDMLFTEGGRCEQMFYVISGELLYSLRRSVWGYRAALGEPEIALLEAEDTLEDRLLNPGHWCCEMAMWCPWVHVGRALAMRMSDVLLVDVASFVSVTCSFHPTRRFSALYAEAFVEKMALSGQLWSDVSAFSLEELQDLVQAAQERRRPPTGVVVSPTPTSVVASPTLDSGEERGTGQGGKDFFSV